MKYLLYLSILAAVLLTACNNTKNQSANSDPTIEKQVDSDGNHKHSKHDHSNSAHDGHAHDHAAKSPKRSAPKIDESSVKNPLTRDLLDAYLQLKNGLVADDKGTAAKVASKLIDRFKSFDKSKVKPEQLNTFDEIVENATEQVEHIAKSDLAHQREHFEVLTADIYDLIRLLGTDKTLYEVFCPMANKGKGAIWLSETKEIRNPYFGAKMLKCGKVTKQIN